MAAREEALNPKLSPKTLNSQIAALEEALAVCRRTSRRGGGGGQTSALYHTLPVSSHVPTLSPNGKTSLPVRANSHNEPRMPLATQSEVMRVSSDQRASRPGTSMSECSTSSGSYGATVTLASGFFGPGRSGGEKPVVKASSVGLAVGVVRALVSDDVQFDCYLST
jgi:hypothetical protein